MAPTLYMFDESPPARAVLITAKAIGLNLTLKEIDFVNGEHLKPEYAKINPQRTIPTLVDDDGFTIWESHALMAYIVSKYAKNDSLYPKDIKKRAIVDQRLHFESGVLFPTLKAIMKPIIVGGKTKIEEKDIEGIHEVYNNLEVFLGDNKWVCGDSTTIADYSLVSSISSLCPAIPIDPQKLPKLTAWLKRMEALPEYEVNKKGVQKLTQALKNKLGNNM